MRLQISASLHPPIRCPACAPTPPLQILFTRLYKSTLAGEGAGAAPGGKILPKKETINEVVGGADEEEEEQELVPGQMLLEVSVSVADGSHAAGAAAIAQLSLLLTPLVELGPLKEEPQRRRFST